MNESKEDKKNYHQTKRIKNAESKQSITIIVSQDDDDLFSLSHDFYHLSWVSISVWLKLIRASVRHSLASFSLNQQFHQEPSHLTFCPYYPIISTIRGIPMSYRCSSFIRITSNRTYQFLNNFFCISIPFLSISFDACSHYFPSKDCCSQVSQGIWLQS